MDKMKERPVEERRKFLFTGMIASGILLVILGLWDISSNLVSLNDNSSNVAAADANKTTPSLFSSLSSEVVSAWWSMKSSLQILNDKLGTLKDRGQVQQAHESR